MSGNKAKQHDQRGMVSFLVTMVMMIVITLIVIGFSQVTRRNQRETLDRQLSAQAFYAAESGVNVTRSAIATYVTANGYGGLATKTACANDYSATSATGSGSIVPLSNGIQYTCVLVNPTPSNLQFSATQQDSAVMPISSNANLKTLTVSWSMQDGGSRTTCTGPTDLTFGPSATWSSSCDLGVLRLDLIQNPSTSATGYTTLDNNTVTLFLTPSGTHGGVIPSSPPASTVAFGTSQTVYVGSGVDATSGAGKCTSGACKVLINLPGNSQNYEFRATMLYKDSRTVTISGTTTSGAATFYGAQAVVDVTGQGQDELRRIQARVALNSTGSNIPANAVASSTGICKHFSLLPTDNLTLSTAATCN